MSVNQKLLKHSRELRVHSTDAEIILWAYLRRKQILGIKFNRQKPIDRYIIDFYSAQVKLAIEIDGAQHFDDLHLKYDLKRDSHLLKRGIKTLRFTNLDIFKNIDDVLQGIYRECKARI
jgi:very-short-patch-repair endonuclease